MKFLIMQFSATSCLVIQYEMCKFCMSCAKNIFFFFFLLWKKFLETVVMKSFIFWDKTSCSPTEIIYVSGETYSLLGLYFKPANGSVIYLRKDFHRTTLRYTPEDMNHLDNNDLRTGKLTAEISDEIISPRNDALRIVTV
jgi:hypothetical protein